MTKKNCTPKVTTTYGVQFYSEKDKNSLLHIRYFSLSNSKY